MDAMRGGAYIGHGGRKSWNVNFHSLKSAAPGGVKSSLLEHGYIKQFALWELGAAVHGVEELVACAVQRGPFTVLATFRLNRLKRGCVCKQRPALL